MRVEMVGGPNDGQVYDFPDGLRHIKVPVLDDPMLLHQKETFESAMRTVELHVQRRKDGRFFMQWPSTTQREE
jgi:hypothetical protein